MSLCRFDDASYQQCEGIGYWCGCRMFVLRAIVALHSGRVYSACPARVNTMTTDAFTLFEGTKLANASLAVYVRTSLLCMI
jgi:hypothetical protein